MKKTYGFGIIGCGVIAKWHLESIDAIDEDRAPLVDVYEGKRTVEVILKAYEASKSGTKVVL